MSPAGAPAAQRLPARRRDGHEPGPGRRRRRRWRSWSGPSRRPSSSGCGRGSRRARRRAGGSRHARADRTPADRVARGIGLALGWHGAGFTGSGEEKMGSVASLELTARRPDPDPDRLDRDGPGDEDDLPAARRGGARGRHRRGRDGARRTPSIVPDSGPTVASRTAMVVGGLRDPRRAAAQGGGRGAHRPGRSRLSYRDDAREHGPTRIDERFEPYPGRHFDDATYTGDAYPSYGWAAAVAEVEVDLDTAEVTVLSVVAADDVGRVIHPVLCEGQVEGGTLQAVGYATIEEIKLLDGRYLNDRLATYLIPTVARRAAARDDPRRGPVRGCAARRQGGGRAADGRRGAGGRRRDPRRDRRLDPRPARDAGADPGRAGRDRAARTAGRVRRSSAVPRPPDRGAA